MQFFSVSDLVSDLSLIGRRGVVDVVRVSERAIKSDSETKACKRLGQANLAKWLGPRPMPTSDETRNKEVSMLTVTQTYPH